MTAHWTLDSPTFLQVLPIENQMARPQDMLGWRGVLNISMVSIAR